MNSHNPKASAGQDKILVNMKWKKLRLNILHAPEEGEGRITPRAPTRNPERGKTLHPDRGALAPIVTQSLVGANPTCQRTVSRVRRGPGDVGEKNGSYKILLTANEPAMCPALHIHYL